MTLHERHTFHIAVGTDWAKKREPRIGGTATIIGDHLRGVARSEIGHNTQKQTKRGVGTAEKDGSHAGPNGQNKCSGTGGPYR
eukprot:5154841-Pleurochrysis_carterae.AAC.1